MLVTRSRAVFQSPLLFGRKCLVACSGPAPCFASLFFENEHVNTGTWLFKINLRDGKNKRVANGRVGGGKCLSAFTEAEHLIECVFFHFWPLYTSLNTSAPFREIRRTFLSATFM